MGRAGGPNPGSRAEPSLKRPPAFPDTAPRARPEPGLPVILDAGEYQIRSLRPHDASEQLQAWLADPDLMWGLNLDTAGWSIEKLQQFVLSFDNRTRYLLGIFGKRPHALIGFYRIDVNPTHRVAHLAVGIGDRAYWGRNVLIETTPALLDHLFGARTIEKVVARILPANRRILFNFMNSKRFFYEGRLTAELLAPNGERHDVLSFAALKSPRAPA